MVKYLQAEKWFLGWWCLTKQNAKAISISVILVSLLLFFFFWCETVIFLTGPANSAWTRLFKSPQCCTNGLNFTSWHALNYHSHLHLMHHFIMPVLLVNLYIHSRMCQHSGELWIWLYRSYGRHFSKIMVPSKHKNINNESNITGKQQILYNCSPHASR